MSVLLLRHTRPQAVDGLCYGVSDVAVGWDFEEALGQVRQQLGRRAPVVVSSPLTRCLRLAMALSRVVHVEERLRELDFGRWEGRRWENLPRGELDAWCADPVRRRPPEGESFQELQMRAVAALGDALLVAEGADLLLCTHAGVIRALLAYAHGLSLEQALEIPVGFAEIFDLDLAGAGLALGSSARLMKGVCR